MPSYEYKCKNCGGTFEIRRGFFEKEKKVRCPQCGSEETQRVYSFWSRGSSGDSCSTSSFG